MPPIRSIHHAFTDLPANRTSNGVYPVRLLLYGHDLRAVNLVTKLARSLMG